MFSMIMYTTLFVTDQDKALDFYTTMFGFEKRVDYPGPEGRFLTIAFKGQALEVILWPGVAEPAKHRDLRPSLSQAHYSLSQIIFGRTSRCSDHTASISRTQSPRTMRLAC